NMARRRAKIRESKAAAEQESYIESLERRVSIVEALMESKMAASTSAPPAVPALTSPQSVSTSVPSPPSTSVQPAVSVPSPPSTSVQPVSIPPSVSIQPAVSAPAPPSVSIQPSVSAPPVVAPPRTFGTIAHVGT
ncbi:hypothetical protein CEUSTIGMA_g13955.t1, partial [Chlamydomonas eustigma]